MQIPMHRYEQQWMHEERERLHEGRERLRERNHNDDPEDEKTEEQIRKMRKFEETFAKMRRYVEQDKESFGEYGYQQRSHSDNLRDNLRSDNLRSRLAESQKSISNKTHNNDANVNNFNANVSNLSNTKLSTLSLQRVSKLSPLQRVSAETVFALEERIRLPAPNSRKRFRSRLLRTLQRSGKLSAQALNLSVVKFDKLVYEHSWAKDPKDQKKDHQKKDHTKDHPIWRWQVSDLEELLGTTNGVADHEEIVRRFEKLVWPLSLMTLKALAPAEVDHLYDNVNGVPQVEHLPNRNPENTEAFGEIEEPEVNVAMFEARKQVLTLLIKKDKVQLSGNDFNSALRWFDIFFDRHDQTWTVE
jgi:hypothetical protein